MLYFKVNEAISICNHHLKMKCIVDYADQARLDIYIVYEVADAKLRPDAVWEMLAAFSSRWVLLELMNKTTPLWSKHRVEEGYAKNNQLALEEREEMGPLWMKGTSGCEGNDLSHIHACGVTNYVKKVVIRDSFR